MCEVDGEIKEWFEVRQGVRQGCPVSPWLFNICLDMVVRKARVSFQGGVTLNTCKVQVLLFADSTVLVADNEEDLKHNITLLQEAAREHKLQINWGKTNTMVISKEPMECNIEVEEHSVKSMKEVVYLGVKFRRVGIECFWGNAEECIWEQGVE